MTSEQRYVEYIIDFHMRYRSILFGLVRLHILYHASKEKVFGLEMIRELARRR